MATNIEKSELVIATILAHLLDQGLQRSMLGFKSLGLSDEYANFYPVCFRWLVSEGLVSAYALSDIMDGNLQVTNPVLTAHGLAVMAGGHGEEDQRRGWRSSHRRRN